MSKLLTAFRRHLLRMALSLAILLGFLLHAVQAVEWPFLRTLENLAYDARVRLTMPGGLDPRIVIVDIDEKSLAEIGRWPWGRHVLAQLLDTLFDTYRVNLVGFDVVFAEPDRSSGLGILQDLGSGLLRDNPAFLQTLQKLTPELDYDARFAASLKGRRVVLGFPFLSQGEEGGDGGKPLPEPPLRLGQARDLALAPPAAAGYVANLPQFQASALGSGHFNSLPDPDGVTRRVPLLYAYQDGLYPALSLSMAQVFLGGPPLEMEAAASGDSAAPLEALRLGRFRIPVDQHAQALIPFRGKRGSFPYVSLSDVLQQRLPDPKVLEDAIVLVGTTAAGLFDMRAAPVEEVYPGVEVHANLIAGMLDRRMLGHPSYMLGAEVLFLLGLGLLMILALPFMGPFWATLGTLGLLGGTLWFNLQVWEQAHLLMPLASLLLLVLTLYLFNMSYGYFVESHSRHKTLKLFGQYVPPELVDEISRNLASGLSVQGESRELSVLFSDVRGFTTLSEGLEPHELSELMNHYLTPMTQIIHRHRGTIDKYMGDAIMAFWGAPLPDPQHARNALSAALEMLRRLEELQPAFRAKGWPELKIGIGLNTGIMSVGNMGSEFRMAYTVMGDAVNLGSRLEGLTKQYGVAVILGETTKNAVPEYAYRELDRVRVKGKDRPVGIFEPLGLAGELDDARRAALRQYEAALACYRNQDWENAAAGFRQLAAAEPDCLLYALYLERIAYFRAQPPGAEWDGVFTHTSK